MPEVVAIAHDSGAGGAALLDRALALAGFPDAMAPRIAQALAERGACTAMVVPALDAFEADSPARTDPGLVEHLLDVLLDLGVTEASVGSTRATAALWLENRDVDASRTAAVSSVTVSGRVVSILPGVSFTVSVTVDAPTERIEP